MHTVMVVMAGFALLGALVWLMPSKAIAARFFIPVWLVASLVNLWVGVTSAGYTVAQEMPIMAIVFAIPAAVAVLVWRRSSGTS